MKTAPRTESPARNPSISVDAAIRARVATAKQGQVFTPADFVDLGSRAAVDKVLSRLTAAGELRRIGRGLYDKPRAHPLLGPLMPTVDDIAKAIAGRSKLRFLPSGVYAANLLGLSEQVPLKLALLTDGVSRTFQVGGQQITLKHTTPRNMETAGRVSGLVIQALRHLKQPRVDEKIIKTLQKRLSAKDKAVLVNDAHLAPVWIAKVMRRIAAGEDRIA